MNKTKILIVDDYTENIRALSELIAAADIEIFSATNADQALEHISQNEFGLVLLDVQMPGTSGLELAKIIRSVKKYVSLPIIFVTAHHQDSDVIFQSYQTGAVDLLFKPLDAYMVRAKVQMFVELARQKALLQSHVAELERLRVEADAANVIKSQFLANMSHEIRTPLAAVLGFSELISKSQPGSEETKELSAAIDRNGKLLLRLIDDILDLSRIEANRLELERVRFDLKDIIRDVDSALSFRAQEKGLNLSFNIPKVFPQQYISDPTRIKQILLNIVGNAIKFTSAGTVNVDITVVSSQTKENTDNLVVQVKDQGIGLSPEQQERLFQPFGQADPSTRRQFGGSGLGLVISRQLANALGGEIRLTSSDVGVGSTFLIRLPLECAKLKSADKESRKIENLQTLENLKLTDKRILAVDDSPDNLTLISFFLKNSGAIIHYAENGQDAIDEVKKHNFDLILIDVQMPGMDGHEATDKIRKMGFSKPILALTAHAIRTEHDDVYNRVGYSKVLTKPIARTTLLKELFNHLG
ncbi:MAG: response regulator [Bdellovibrionaceae bacterium]|nr:response regulator [Pseudobdellovibrionaceae bacterium]